MKEDEVKAGDIWPRAEKIAFNNGGWLVVATAFEMTPDCLRRKLKGQIGTARLWLSNMERRFGDA